MFLAYIDPGAGSLIIQAVIAGLVTLPILFRRQLARVTSVLRHANGESNGGNSNLSDGD